MVRIDHARGAGDMLPRRIDNKCYNTLGPANAATAVGCMLCAVGLATIPSQPEKKAADAVRDELQTPASRENIVKLLARREKPANALGRGSKLFIHPAEAPENNSIARVCMRHRTSPSGKISSAPTRAENMDAVQQCWQLATAACELRNCHQLVRNSASTALG